MTAERQKPVLAFLIQGHDAPSTRVRVLNLLPFFHAAGFATTVDVFPNTRHDWRAVWPHVRAADVVVIQKRLPSLIEAWLLRRRARRLVFDFDDSVWLRNREGDARPSRKLRTRFAHFLKRVDLAICGNPILEARLRATCPGTSSVIIPSAVPAPVGADRAFPSVDSPASTESTASRPQRIGWVGTAINLPYLVAIEDELAAAHAETPFELEVISSAPPQFRSFTHFRYVPWSADTEYARIAQFDIGLMPLADNEHSRGKCAYKALQYMSCGVAVVASDVGVNREWIEQPGAGLVVRNDEWKTALARVLSDAESRAKMGRAGVEAIRTGFTQEVVAAKYLREFRALVAATRD